MSVGTFVNDIHDTIVAVASGPAVARRGIVRVSGPGTVELVMRCFQPMIASGWPTTSARRWAGRFRTAEPGQEPCTLPVDLWLWPTVRTYTGQPSAEFHLPGIPYLLDQVVQQCLRDGARMAGPGEFTLRAFLAGRLDLLQAQAVLRVIEAQDPQQLHVALAQLAGGLSTPLQQFREQLIAVLAHLEAGLDFVEEEIEFISQAQLLQDLTEVQTQVSAMIEQLRQRREIGRLPRVVLVGPPNAGKSSLFNALLGQDLALVSPVQGTTRDYLSGRWQVDGRACELIDTAGLEQGGGPARLATSGPAPPATVTADDLERLGQQQAWTLLPTADVLLLCWDATRGPEGLDDWLEWLPKRPSMLVLGKDDLAQPADYERWSNWTTRSGNAWPCYWVSPATGHGLNELPRAVEAALLKVTEPPDAAPQLESAQSLDDLEQIEMALQEAIEIAAQGGGEELVAAELHRAVERLGRLVGTIYTDDILDSIFSRFCIGK